MGSSLRVGVEFFGRSVRGGEGKGEGKGEGHETDGKRGRRFVYDVMVL